MKATAWPLAAALLLTLGCGNPETTPTTSTTEAIAEQAAAENIKTTVSFAEPDHDFGTITEGETLLHTFVFKNTGTAPLVLTNVRASCGCTVPNWDKEPIPPGEQGRVEVRFNSEGRSGVQHKSVRVYANIPEEVITLSFTANVRQAD